VEVAVVDACKWVVVIREISRINTINLLLIIRRTPLAWMTFVVWPRVVQTDTPANKCRLDLPPCFLLEATVGERWALVAH
jgi:hypothetical protein